MTAAPLCASPVVPGALVAVPCAAASPLVTAGGAGKAAVEEVTGSLVAQYPQSWIAASGCVLGMGAPQPLSWAGVATVATVHAADAAVPALWATAPAAVSVIAPPSALPAANAQFVRESQPLLPKELLPSAPAGLAEAPKLTRGARRHLKQRLRKKLGKLERARAASGPEAPEAERPEHAEEIASSPKIPGSNGTEEVLIHVIEGTQQGALGLPVFDVSVPALGTADAEQTVPVCAVQSDLQLHEDADLDIVDACVALPRRGEGPEPARSTARMATWPAEGARLPTANTFVHFPIEREQVRRRSLSV